jgi:hypothetical protein
MSPNDRTLLVSRGLIFLVALSVTSGAVAAPAPGDDGGVIGWVEDAKGTPIAGVLVSLFGKGLREGGLVLLSDSTGRFFAPSVPAGSYTIRALGQGRALTQRITVLPNQDSIFTLSFAAPQRADREASLENGSTNDRELKWLLRHKRRSVLETRAVEAEEARVAESIGRGANLLETLLPWIPELGGAVEVMSTPGSFGGTAPARGFDLGAPSLGSLKLNGKLSESSSWSLGGLVADSENATWRMAAEFVVEPGEGHQLQAGAGYGTRFLQPGFAAAGSGALDNRTVGAVFVHERWQIDDRFTLAGGVRYSYIGFVGDKGSFSPTLGLEYTVGDTRLRGSASARTLTPGGDLLTLSTMQAAPAMAIAMVGAEVRPERVHRHELGVDQAIGRRAAFGAFVFREGVRDRLINDIQLERGALRILNGRGVVATGGGVSLASRMGDAVRSSVSYSFGRSRPGQAPSSIQTMRHADWALASSDATFHDVVARLETFVDWSGTRLIAYYRWNVCRPESGTRPTAPLVSQRFDVRLTQGLPFLSGMTRADWEVLLAFRNMFYEASEAALLDEVAVVNPPKRVLGGISVRF